MYEEFIGTKPVNDRQKFDIGALSDYLRSNIPDFPSTSQHPIEISQFKGGQSNPTFKLSIGEQHYVMRSKPGPAAKLLPSAHAIEREFRVMDALHRAGLPTPQQYALCTDENVIGRAFYIMSFIEGRVLWDQALPQLHTVDYAAIGLGDYGKPGNYFARQIERWSKQYRASETEKIDAMDALIAWLPHHIPAGEDSSIVHGDFRLDNLVFHPTEPRILAILDWELSTIGHPLADFSYHCMSWHIQPGQFRGIAGLDHASLGIPSEQAYIDSYCARTGKTILRKDFNFYLAYNMFRLTGILQGIMKRYVDGTASSEQALGTGKAARSLADLAWHYANSN
jgi:aminoglycoside phosphotransferase (APT) family kinase protein